MGDVMERPKVEANQDEVEAVVRAFAEQTLGADVSNECYAEAKDLYVHMFMGGHPADGFSDEYVDDRVRELGRRVAPLGWFVAKAECVVADDSADHEEAIAAGDLDDEPQTMCFIDVFPCEGPIHEGREPILWHASPSSNRESILAEGIVPKTGGNDYISLPTGRIYVCVHAMFLEHVELDMAKTRRWKDLDLWLIDRSAIPGHSWRTDVEMEHVSAWTDQAIPPDALTLVGPLTGTDSDGWRHLPTEAPSKGERP